MSKLQTQTHRQQMTSVVSAAAGSLCRGLAAAYCEQQQQHYKYNVVDASSRWVLQMQFCARHAQLLPTGWTAAPTKATATRQIECITLARRYHLFSFTIAPTMNDCHVGICLLKGTIAFHESPARLSWAAIMQGFQCLF
eukprot:GHRR01019365.1.p1 GENE.GHRR01019365.1~~GHRR01019365.1.p1  ORF type:complete len:139 (+),score=7.04 GHRR01019365.1:60-476(+)